MPDSLNNLGHLSQEERMQIRQLVWGLTLESVKSTQKWKGVSEDYQTTTSIDASVPSTTADLSHGGMVTLYGISSEMAGKLAKKATPDADAVSVTVTVYCLNDKGDSIKLKTIKFSFKPTQCDPNGSYVTGKVSGDVEVENFNLKGQGATNSGYKLDTANGTYK